MKNKWISIALMGLIASMVLGAPIASSILLKTNGEENARVAAEHYQPIITSTTHLKTVSLLNTESVIYKVATAYIKGKVQDYYKKGENAYYPEATTILWASAMKADYYNFEIGLKSDLSDATEYITFETSVELADLFVAKTYYYRITARSAEKTVRSRIFSFQTAALPRTINVPSVSNTRDIGGYYTVDGKYQVKQGLFYRGGAIDADGIDTLLNTYGIKTDLDVRGDGSSTTGASPLGSGVNYVECTGPYYIGSKGIDSTNPIYRNALLKEIQTCAVKENYPIYLHCSLGRDRTGTLVFLINSLLGVGEMDLFMDYELSWFSESGTRDAATPRAMVDSGGPFDKLYNYIKTYSTGTLQQNTEKFMLDLGVTSAEISSIRQILLEEVQK